MAADGIRERQNNKIKLHTNMNNGIYKLSDDGKTLLTTQQQLAQAQTEAEYWKSAYENIKANHL